MPDPKVVVLVLSYDGKDLLEDALSSYLASDYPNYEVVVIDNGSNDGTSDYVRTRFPQVSIVRTDKNLGYSGGFNLGLAAAFEEMQADYALVTNNDVKVDSAAISELVKVAWAHEKVGFVTGKVMYFDHPTIFQTVGKKEDPVRWNGDHIGRGEEDHGQYDEVRELPFADDVYTLISRDLYQDTEGYDTTFFLQAEEYDWQARGKKLGYKIMYAPLARLWHKESMTIGKTSPLKAYYDARNPMLVILLHKPPAYFKRYFWLHFRKDVLKASLVSIRQRKLSIALSNWRGFFSGIGWGIKNRKLSLKHFI